MLLAKSLTLFDVCFVHFYQINYTQNTNWGSERIFLSKKKKNLSLMFCLGVVDTQYTS